MATAVDPWLLWLFSSLMILSITLAKIEGYVNRPIRRLGRVMNQSSGIGLLFPTLWWLDDDTFANDAVPAPAKACARLSRSKRIVGLIVELGGLIGCFARGPKIVIHHDMWQTKLLLKLGVSNRADYCHWVF